MSAVLDTHTALWSVFDPKTNLANGDAGYPAIGERREAALGFRNLFG